MTYKSLLKYRGTENVLINHLFLVIPVIPMSLYKFVSSYVTKNACEHTLLSNSNSNMNLFSDQCTLIIIQIKVIWITRPMLNVFCVWFQMRRGRSVSYTRATAGYTAHESFIQTESSTPVFHACLTVRSVLMPTFVLSAEKATIFRAASVWQSCVELVSLSFYKIYWQAGLDDRIEHWSIFVGHPEVNISLVLSTKM